MCEGAASYGSFQRARFTGSTGPVRRGRATAAARKAALLFSAISLAMPATSSSQVPVTVVPGDSVRIWTAAEYAGSGSVLDADSARIRWVTDLTGATLTTAVDSIGRMEVHLGYRRRPLRGALVGALAGGVVFGLAGDWHAENVGFRAAGGIMLGMPLGLLFGALAKSDIWEAATLPRSLSMRLVPEPLGIRVALSIHRWDCSESTERSP